jgi:hypothetical protein
MRVFLFRVCALVLAVLAVGVGRATAQFETASVVGTVHDASGAVVPGAKVTLTSSATGVALTRTTSSDGAYEFATVRSGIYIVTSEKDGFSLALVDNVQVQVGARLRVDLQMAIGQVSEKVEVTASAPLIDTDSSQRSQVITGDQMRELALNGREYSSQHLQQLPDRWRGQQRLRHQQPGLLQPGDAAVTRRGHRISSRHQQSERRVWTRGRSDRQRRLQERVEPVPRCGVGVLPQHGAELDDLFPAAGRPETAAHA